MSLRSIVTRFVRMIFTILSLSLRLFADFAVRTRTALDIDVQVSPL